MTAREIARHHRAVGAEADEPVAATDLSLAASIEHACWLSQQDVAAPCDCGPIHALVRDCRWQRDATPATSRGSADLRALTMPSAPDFVRLRTIETSLRQRLLANGFTVIATRAFAGIIGELVGNVWEHSNTATPALVVYQVEQGQVFLGIADAGIGILASLRTNPQYADLRTSTAALCKALEPGVSRLPGPDRGLGFAALLRAASDQWGCVRVRTGEAICTLNGTSDFRQANITYGVPLPGVQIVVICRTRVSTRTIEP